MRAGTPPEVISARLATGNYDLLSSFDSSTVMPLACYGKTTNIFGELACDFVGRDEVVEATAHFPDDIVKDSSGLLHVFS